MASRDGTVIVMVLLCVVAVPSFVMSDSIIDCAAYNSCVLTKVYHFTESVQSTKTLLGDVSVKSGTTVQLVVPAGAYQATCAYLKEDSACPATLSHYIFYSCSGTTDLAADKVACNAGGGPLASGVACPTGATCQLPSPPATNTRASDLGAKCGDGTTAACILTPEGENVYAIVKDKNSALLGSSGYLPSGCSCMGANAQTSTCLITSTASCTAPVIPTPVVTTITGAYTCPDCAGTVSVNGFTLIVSKAGGANLCKPMGTLDCTVADGKVTISGDLSGAPYDAYFTPLTGTYLAVVTTVGATGVDPPLSCGVTVAVPAGGAKIAGLVSGSSFTLISCPTVAIGPIVVSCAATRALLAETINYDVVLQEYSPWLGLSGVGCPITTKEAARAAGFPGTYKGTVTYKGPWCPATTPCADGPALPFVVNCPKVGDAWESAAGKGCTQTNPMLTPFEPTSIQLTGTADVTTCSAAGTLQLQATLHATPQPRGGCEGKWPAAVGPYVVPSPTVDGLDPRFDYEVKIGGLVTSKVNSPRCGAGRGLGRTCSYPSAAVLKRRMA